MNADKIKDEAGYIKKMKTEDESWLEFKKNLSFVEKMLQKDGVKNLEEALGQQTILYKIFKAARKLEAVTNIGVDYVDEVQGYWATAATMGPVAGPLYGLGMSGLATVRAGMAAAKVAGFAKGGATGHGMAAPQGQQMGLWDMFSMANGMSVAGNGKLRDGSGFNIAGVVQEDEYVIPKWLREDSQVMEVEGWLERRRLQGYAQGGATGGDGSQAGTEELGRPAESTDHQLVRVLEALDQRL